jgi:hypothetical protein
MSTIVEATPTVVPVTRRDVLRRAADLLEEFGWCQMDEARAGDEPVSVNDSRVDRFCIGGAVRRALIELTAAEHDNHPYDYIGQVWDGNIVDWNDAPGRTKSEVVARLREAAERT